MANKKSFFMGALVGSVLGGMSALLFAPKSGAKVRKDIGRKCAHAGEKTGEMIDFVGDKAQEIARSLSSSATDLMDRARDVAEKARDAADDMTSEIKRRRKRK